MAKISSPKEPDTLDRHLDCEKALENAFEQLLSDAVQAGWEEDETCDAIANLADRYIIAIYESAPTAQIHEIARKKH